jgi:TolA-binding protein
MHRLLLKSLLCSLLVFSCCSCIGMNLAAEEIDNASARAFNAAAALQNAGLHARAATKWTEFISQFPNDQRIGQANYFLAVCALRDKRFNDAVQMFQNVVSRWPDIQQADKAQYNLAMARYELAAQTKNMDAFRQSANDFQQVGAKYPNSDFVDDAAYYQSDCLFNAGNVTEAITAYQNLIAKYPSSPRAARAYYDLGIAQQELGKSDDAVKTFQTFLAKPEYTTHELSAEIRLRGAICLYEQTRFDEAAKLLVDNSDWFANSDYRIDAIKLAGQCYFMAEKPMDAVRVLTPIASIDAPQKIEVVAEAAYWLGRSQLKLNQPDQALSTLDAAIGRFKNTTFVISLQFARIDAMYEIPARRAETPALYEGFAREHPTHALAPQAAYMAAFSAFGQQQYRKARELAETYLGNPANQPTIVVPDMKYIAAEAYLLEAVDKNTQQQAEARTKAESLYRDLVAKNPEHARASRSHLRIGWCLFSSDGPQEAIQYLRGTLNKFEAKEQLPEAQWLIGRSHAQLNQHREAINSFNAAITANDQWGQLDEVLLAAGGSYRALGELDPATEQLKRLVNSKPDSALRPQALFELGEISRQRDQMDQAIEWFKQVADRYAASEFGGPAIHALAAAHLSKQQYGQAREWTNRLIDGAFSDTLKRRGRYLRGLSFQFENSFAKAIDDLVFYRQNPVNDAEATNASYVLVNCYISEHQYQSAQSELNTLLAAKPDYPNADLAYYELGHSLRKAENKASDAADAFRWIVEHRPDSKLAAESWFRIAQYQSELASQANQNQKVAAYSTAETAVNKGLEKRPVGDLCENMLYLLGDLQFQQQKFTAAAETFKKLIDEFKTGRYLGPATFLAAQSHFQLQQFDVAMPLFSRISETPFPDTTDEKILSYRSQALYQAGECAAKLTRWQESQTYFQRILEQFPKFPQSAEAQYGIAYALQQQGQLDRAIEVYNQVTKSTETETAAKSRFMIGEIKFGQKQYEDAIEHFLTVTVGYPYESWQALARFEAARCFMELGDKTNATNLLRELLEKNANHPRIADAKKMLDDLSK